jgi:hypothetical protein
MPVVVLGLPPLPALVLELVVPAVEEDPVGSVFVPVSAAPSVLLSLLQAAVASSAVANAHVLFVIIAQLLSAVNRSIAVCRSRE